MLRLIKTLGSSKTLYPLNSISLYAAPLQSFSKRKNRDIKKIVAEREQYRYSKKEANTKMIEELFFPDHTKMKVQEYIEEKRRLQETGGEGESKEKVKLDQDDLKYIEDVSSQSVNKAAVEKSFRFPESKEEMTKLIADTDINDKLLKFYMKHHRMAGKQQIFELLNKLKHNLKIQGQVKEREMMKYKNKVRKLKEINKDIEVPFTSIFLTIEEVLEHPGFKFLLNNINFKAKQKIYQPFTVLELYHSLIMFNKKTADMIDREVLKALEQDLETYDIYTIAKYLNLLQHFEELKLSKHDLVRLSNNAYQALNKKDFAQITKKEILAILIPIKKIGIPPNERVMFRLEPYILKYLKEIETNKLADIYLTYLTFKNGSVQFMEFIMTSLLINIKNIDIKYIKTILTLSNSRTARRKDLAFEGLRRGASQELMKKFKDWDYKVEDLLQVLRTFIYDGLPDSNYYDLISVEFIKSLPNMDVNTFMEMYYLLASSDMDSQALSHGCNQKLEETFDELHGVTQEKIAGLLENKDQEKQETQNNILPPDMKLSYYEKSYANRFRQLVRSLWAHTFFIVKKGDYEIINLDLWNQGIRVVNDMITKLKSFSGLVPFSRHDMELVYQINFFSRVHAKNSFEIDVKQLTDVNLLYKDVLHSHPLPFNVSLFWLERNYFVKKYKPVTIKHKEIDGYVYEISLENKSKGSITNIFINDSSDFLGCSSPQEVRGKGHLRLRRHYLQETKAPYVEIGFDQFLKELSNIKNLKEGYMENFLKKLVELPQISDPLGEAEAKKLENIWSQIKEQRQAIPETSLTFEQGLESFELSDKIVEEFLQRKEEAIKEQEATVEDDVYKDSDSEEER